MANACASVSLTCVLTEMENAVSNSSSNAAGVYCGWWHFITIYFSEYWNCDNSVELMLTSFFSALIWRQQETKIHNNILRTASWAPTVIFHTWIDSWVKTFSLSLFVFFIRFRSLIHFEFLFSTENGKSNSTHTNFVHTIEFWRMSIYLNCG